MSRPVIGVIGNTYLVENRFPSQRVGEKNLKAVVDMTGALPLMFAGCPELTDIGALLDAVDGILLTGGRANVHPSRFGLGLTQAVSTPVTRTPKMSSIACRTWVLFARSWTRNVYLLAARSA